MLAAMIDNSVPDFIIVKAAVLGSADRSIRRRFERGELVRVRNGVYLPRETWDQLDFDARYRARVFAAAHAVHYGRQFSHDSAAALWRLPSLGPWSNSLHVSALVAAGDRSPAGLIRHNAQPDPFPVDFSGARVTSLARTVVDIARTEPFARAVCMTDDALRTPEDGDFRFRMAQPAISKDELLAVFDTLGPTWGLARARKVVSFSTGKSGSVGESVSRVNFATLGLPSPELQVPFFDEDGFIGEADFYFPEVDGIGEFDGEVKYRDQRYLRGQLPHDVLMAEKKREDRMRRVVRSFVRWDWEVATDLRKLSERVATLGLVRSR